MRETLDSGRLGPELHIQFFNSEHCGESGLPRLRECFWNCTNEYTSDCTGSAAQLMDAKHQIQVYIHNGCSREAEHVCHDQPQILSSGEFTRAGWPTGVPVHCWRLNHFSRLRPQQRLSQQSSTNSPSCLLKGPLSWNDTSHLWLNSGFLVSRSRLALN